MPLSTFLSAWTFEPSVVLGLALVAAVYVAGLRELDRRGRFGRAVGWRHAPLFALGLVALALALLSPIDAFAGRLLTLHMAQHLLLLAVAPPLLLLGKPIPVLLVGAPHGLVRWVARANRRTPWLHALSRALVSPALTWPLYVGAFIAWHIPVFYQAALRNEGIHLIEHLCFLFTALLYWWVIIQPAPGRDRVHVGVRMLYIWTAAIPTDGLALLISSRDKLWYPFYAAQPRMWGLSPLDDQRLGGYVMWGPSAFIDAATLSVLFFFVLMRPDQHMVLDDAEEIARRAMAGASNTANAG